MTPDWRVALDTLREHYTGDEVAAMLKVHPRAVDGWVAGEYMPSKPRRRQLVKKALHHCEADYTARLKAAQEESDHNVG